MGPEAHRAFLRSLSEASLFAHLRMYVRNGMDSEAARADMEIERRRRDRRARRNP